MAIVMISSLSQGGREELAQAMWRKTSWPMLSREELQEKARQQGIKVGRLEMSMIKRPSLSEKLAREKDFYLAFLTASLCEKALEDNLIYTGRAGHLLLPGVSHRLRVGLTAPQEVRIKRAAQALNMQLDQAEHYLMQLDEDIDRWIRTVHRTDGLNPKHFDVFFNLENISVAHTADLLCNMAEMPDYQPTAASTVMLKDLYLSSQAKVRLALDERTRGADCQVLADKGVVTVTYPPHQQKVSELIPQVLRNLDGCREILCTMAETNILWVQEHFEAGSENFQQIIRLAQRWGAAVELMRLIPPGELQGDQNGNNISSGYDFGRRECKIVYDGGVEDDETDAVEDDGGLGATQEELVNLGRSGGQCSVCGGYDKILERAQGEGRYSLVVVGDMFLSKVHSTRTRQTRELAMRIRNRLKAPVITADELKARFLFGKQQLVTLVGFLAMVAMIYWLVFTNQQQVLAFMSGPSHLHTKWLAPASVVLFIPLIAYLYGTVAELVLKIFNID